MSGNREKNLVGVSDLFESMNIKKSEFRSQMKESGIPFSYSNYETFYNLIDGKTRPRDPMVYIYLSNKLSIPLEEILLRYSETEHAQLEDIEMIVDSHKVVINSIDKTSW